MRWLPVLVLLAAGCSPDGDASRAGSSAQAADSAAECAELDLYAPHIRMADPGHRAPTRTGPGDAYPEHRRGPLDRRERVYVLQECGDWVRGRTIPAGLIRREVAGLSEDEARDEIIFWVRADHIR